MAWQSVRGGCVASCGARAFFCSRAARAAEADVRVPTTRAEYAPCNGAVPRVRVRASVARHARPPPNSKRRVSRAGGRGGGRRRDGGCTARALTLQLQCTCGSLARLIYGARARRVAFAAVRATAVRIHRRAAESDAMVLQQAISYLGSFVTHRPSPPCVGVYYMLDTLGCGNFGKVRRARHAHTGQYFAVKIVQTSVLKHDLPANLDIRREMSILRALTHPNIIHLHDVMVSNTRVYLVMDLASGGDFYNVIAKKGRLCESLARRYFRQLVDAVHFCHQHHVFHRDLKPENLLLDSNGNLKVTDFGFSAMKDHGSLLLRTNCGSPHYCAPEVWNGSQLKGYDGAKSDAFSIGVILFVLLSGSQPFYDPNERVLLEKVNRCQVKYPPFLPPDAVDLMSKLIVRCPKHRWSLDMVKRHPWYLAGSLENSLHSDISDDCAAGLENEQHAVEICNKCKMQQCAPKSMVSVHGTAVCAADACSTETCATSATLPVS
eukprot:TRINITY_DN726_c0_g1_i1.p2 TRINITY_DN726_c0_g1~~TRINITY_DN726_c0_g1_i1.p2  ORF type:complete len:492 (+),score=87.82 TRINITY_DN726_c0_g1_i1:171-1646(+)